MHLDPEEAVLTPVGSPAVAANPELFAEILSNNRLIATNKKDTLVLWCLKTGKSLKMIKDHESLTNKVISYHF